MTFARLRALVLSRLSVLGFSLLLASSGSCNVAAERYRRMISESEVRLFATILRLSDEQGAVADALYDDYCQERLASGLTQRVRDYARCEKSAIEEVTERVEAGEDPSVVGAEVWGPLDDELEALNPLLEALDQRFLHSLTAILTDEQLPRMYRVRLARLRRTNRNYNPQLPGSDVDVVALLYEIVPPPTESPQVEIFLRGFEPTYNAALDHCERTEHDTGDTVRRASSIGYRMRTESLSDAEHAELLEDYKRVRHQYMSKKVRAAEAIVRLNRLALVELTQVLSKEQGDLLRSRYDHEVYPKILPDPASAEGMVAAALALDDIEEYQAEAIENWAAEYRRRHELYTQRMIRETDKFWKLRALAEEKDRIEKSMTRDELISLGTEREDLSDNLVLNIESVLWPHQFARLPKWPEEHERPWERP